MAETREQNLVRYSRLYIENCKLLYTKEQPSKLSGILYDLRSRAGYGYSIRRSWIGQTETQVRNSISRENVSISILTGKAVTISKIRHFGEYNMQTDYVLDRGIPYFRQQKTKTFNILLVDNLPSYRSDPLKVARSAAFLGLVFFKPKNADDVERFSEKMKTSLSRIK
ncbi:hypothetical protein ACFLV0_04110 [Chloroflexota bacterium]